MIRTDEARPRRFQTGARNASFDLRSNITHAASAAFTSYGSLLVRAAPHGQQGKLQGRIGMSEGSGWLPSTADFAQIRYFRIRSSTVNHEVERRICPRPVA
jgi:hypothetical protein